MKILHLFILSILNNAFAVPPELEDESSQAKANQNLQSSEIGKKQLLDQAANEYKKMIYVHNPSLVCNTFFITPMMDFYKQCLLDEDKNKKKFQDVGADYEEFFANANTMNVTLSIHDLPHFIRGVKLEIRAHGAELRRGVKTTNTYHSAQEGYYWINEQDGQEVLSYFSSIQKLEDWVVIYDYKKGSIVSRGSSWPGNYAATHLTPIDELFSCKLQVINENEIECLISNEISLVSSSIYFLTLFSNLKVNLPEDRFVCDSSTEFDDSLKDEAITDAWYSETDPIKKEKYRKELCFRYMTSSITFEEYMEYLKKYYNIWRNREHRIAVIKAKSEVVRDQMTSNLKKRNEGYLQEYPNDQFFYEYTTSPLNFFIGLASLMPFDFTEDSNKYLVRDPETNKIRCLVDRYDSFTLYFLNYDDSATDLDSKSYNFIKIVGNNMYR